MAMGELYFQSPECPVLEATCGNKPFLIWDFEHRKAAQVDTRLSVALSRYFSSRAHASCLTRPFQHGGLETRGLPMCCPSYSPTESSE